MEKYTSICMTCVFFQVDINKCVNYRKKRFPLKLRKKKFFLGLLSSGSATMFMCVNNQINMCPHGKLSHEEGTTSGIECYIVHILCSVNVFR